ncbi:MAG: hypothetical protein EOO54_07790, partial [Haliea sp.]
LTLAGGNLSFEYETFDLNGKVITTSGVQAGSITITGSHINLSNGSLLALSSGTGKANGDIKLIAEDIYTDFSGQGFANIDYNAASITLTKMVISGGNVTLRATAAASKYDIDFGESKVGTTLASAAGSALGAIENLSLIAGVAHATSKATITVDSTTTINAAEFVAHATAKTVAAPNPLGFGLGVSVGIVDTTAKVTIAGTINATGSITLRSTADNTLNVVSKPSNVSSYDAAIAVSVLQSESTAHATGTSRLTSGGSLFVLSETIDRNRTLAESLSPTEGKLAVAFTVSVESGQTNAWLDGFADAGGDLSVSASTRQEDIKSSQFFGMIPTIVGGVKAGAGVGVKSTGNLINDVQKTTTDAAMQTSFIKGIKDKATDGAMGIVKKWKWAKEQIESDTTNKWDVGASIAVVVDTNQVDARIGDGNRLNGLADVEANGNILLSAVVQSRPDVSAATTVKNETSKPATAQANADLGVSVAIAVGIYNDTANATINGDAAVDAMKTLTVRADTLNQIDPTSVFGASLVSPFLNAASGATFQSTDGVETVKNNETVQVADGHGAGGDVGSWYKYIGSTPEKSFDLANTDFTKTEFWEDMGSPATSVSKAFVANLTTYLNNNLGLDDHLVDSWSNATVEGQAKAGAGSFSVMVLNHDAAATIKGGALINQDTDGFTGNDTFRSGLQSVVVDASSVAHMVNLVGNLKVPGVQGGLTAKDWSLKDSITTPGGGVSTAPGGKGAGVATGFYVFENDVKAVIEDGVTLYGDNLAVTATNDMVVAVLGASGSTGAAGSGNGVLLMNLVENDTLAQVGNGATITLGSRPLNMGASPGAVAWISAMDNSYVFAVAGAVASAENTGVGISLVTNVIQRDTEAVLGNVHGDETSGTLGSFNASGDVAINAGNGGVVGAFAVAGSKAQSNPAKPAPTPPAGGTGGTQGPDGTAQGQADFASWQTKMQAVLKDVVKGVDKVDAAAPDAVEKPAASESSTAVSGAVTINVLVDNTRASVYRMGALTAGDILIDALDDTIVASLAGAAAYSKPAAGKEGLGLAGAFGFNFLGGYTEAYLDYVTNLTADSVDIEAARTGWVVALAAGVSGATGSNGKAIAGSVGVNRTATETNARFGHVTTGKVTGLTSVDAHDDNNIISVAGAAAFGGKGGYGVSLGVNLIEGQISATVDSANLTQSGGYSVTADTDALIVSVAASLGVATGGGGAVGTAVGGTVSVNMINNTLSADILNSTSASGSTGPLTVSATDESSIYAFSGGFALGRAKGFGIAAGVNIIGNSTTAAIENSTLHASGAASVHAGEEATIMSFAVGGAGSDKLAIAGSIGINAIVNGTDAHIKGSTLTTAGAIDVTAEDKSTLVSLAGAVAVSVTENGVGLAVGWNRVSNGITAYINGSNIDSTNGSVNVLAKSSALLVGIGAAGGGGKGTSGAGAVMVNSIANRIDAHINNGSDVSAKNNVSVIASESASLYSASLAVAVSTTGSAIGALLSYNYVGTVDEMADPNLISIADAPAGSDANGSKNVSIAGANGATAASVTAYIDGSGVDAGGTVQVLAGFDDPNKTLESGPSFGGIKTVNAATAVVPNGTGDGTITFGANHGFKTGDEVVYDKGTGNAIGGLVGDKSVKYYVIVIDADTIRLADSFQEALSGHALALTQAGTGNGRIIATDATKTFDAAAGVDTSDGAAENTITFDKVHGFTTGDEVVYDKGAGKGITGLNGNNTVKYYVIVIDDDTIQLAATSADATAGKALTLTKAGTDIGKITSTRTGALAKTFNAATGVATAADTLVFGAAHGFTTGDEVVYDTGTGTQVTGLTGDNTVKYYVIVIDADTIRLASSRANALAGNAVALTQAGTGTGKLTLQASFNAATGVTATNPLANTIGFGTAHGLDNGDVFVYRAGTGNTAIGGLVDGETYYV